MEKMNDLKDLFKHEIQDLYSVEEQIISALPKMIEKARNSLLKKALQDHLKITQQHLSRLEQVQNTLSNKVEEDAEKKGLFSRLFKSKQVCRGMEGILEEGEKIMNEDMNPDVLDAAIIAAAQKVEHYEICGYGTARTYSRELGMEEVTRLLEQTLNEEYEADDLLTQLAITRINIKAESGSTNKGKAEAPAKSSGSRITSGERVRKEEPEMKLTSREKQGAKEKKGNGSSKNGAPKGSVSRTTAGADRGGTASKKATAAGHSKSSSKSSGRNNGRSSSGGRGATGSNSRGR